MTRQTDQSPFDSRVEAYIRGRLAEAEEQQFCEELLQSPELQRQVAELSMLRNGLIDQPTVTQARPQRRWFGYAAAGLVGLAVGGLFLGGPAPEKAVITGAPYTLAGDVRGDSAEAIVLPRRTSGVTVMLPVGRCQNISGVHVVGPNGATVARSGGMSEMPGFTISLRDPDPGTYFAEISYADCPSEIRRFTVPLTLAELQSKASFFDKPWTIRPGPTSTLVKVGGSITFDIDASTSEVWISAGKMGGKESIWNNVDDATLGPMGDTIEGTLVAGLKRYRFSITQDGENIRGHVEQETSAKAANQLGDDGDGDWMGGNGVQ